MKRKNIIISLIINICLISATAVISLSALSIAWFSNNKNVNGDGMDIDLYVDPDSLYSTIELYKFSSDANGGIKFGNESYTNNLDLGEFDNYIRERNVHNNNILKFNLQFLGSYSSTDYRDITIDIESTSSTIGSVFDSGDGKTNRTFKDTTGYEYLNNTNGNSYICNSISNVVYFKTFINQYTVDDSSFYYPNFNSSSTSIISGNTDAKVYSQVTDIFKDTSTYNIAEKTFVNKNSSNNYEKTNTISMQFNNIPGNVTTMELYIEYNYSIPLIDSFNAKSEQTVSTAIESLSTNNVINFQKDLKLISIKTSKQEEGFRQ